MTEPSREDHHDLVAGYLLNALDAPDLEWFRAHVGSCPQCRDEVAALAPVVADLGSVVEHLPPPSVESDVMDALFGSPTPTVARTEAPATPAGTESDTLEDPLSAPGSAGAAAGPGGRRHRWAWPVAAAAAFLLGAVVSASVLARSPDQSAQTEMHQVMQISAFEDAHVMPMDVPAGDATLVVSEAMDKGAIVATDLPMPASDREYVLWTVMGDGSMQSAATFRPDPEGRAAAVLETGVREAQAFMLTIEEPGTSQPTEPPIGEVRT